MNYKEKYEQALERASGFKTAECRDVAEYIFPELAESEDKRIRKNCMKYLDYEYQHNHNEVDRKEIEKCIAWLEKQGKKPIIEMKSPEESLGIDSDTYNKIVDDCIYGDDKQKPADKIEPQFKPGDWIVNNDDDSVGQITKIIEGEDGFAYEHTNGYFHGIFEKDFHLWTIRDAKDGDFLVCPLPKGDGGQVFIFKEIGNREYVDDCIEYYCRVCQDVFYENTTGYMGTASDEFKPATWEQRYLLIQKMKEAGYEWNPDAKVLKKIKRKSQRMVSAETKEALLNESEREALRTEYEKGRADVIAEIQGSTWSEEDRRNLQGIIDEIEANKNNAPDYDLATYDRFLSWLKSLKDRVQPQNRWKPTIAQVKAVEEALNDAGYTYDDLKSLHDDLKKL